VVSGACSDGPPAPQAPTPVANTSVGVGATEGAPAAVTSQANGPETPPFNLQAVLRPSAGEGFGLIRFRQPNDGLVRAYLDTWVRDLAPDSEYNLQRAVDLTLDGVCASESWLTLGHGLAPATLVTDDHGTGRQEFYRDLPPGSVGQMFDIHFRIVSTSGVEVLRTDCYQFVEEPN